MKQLQLIINRKWLWPALLALLGLSAVPARAQTYIEYNSPVTIFNGTVDEYNYVIIGPDAELTIEQDWYVLAQNLYIHPDALIAGPGTIHIMDAGTFGNFPGGLTTIDGGGVPIDARLSIENPNNILLNPINPNGIIAGLGWTDPGTAGTDHLIIDNTLNFGAAGGNVLLNNSNLVFSTIGSYSYSDLNTVDFPGADPVPPAAPNGALLVTNGTGHVVKQSLAGNFKFPVGMAAGDYTPASINPSSTGDFLVQVKDYAGSAATEQVPSEGMDRTWHIYSNNAISASLALQHNTSTNGSLYSDAPAFITQYQGGTSWGSAPLNVDYNGAGDIAGSALHTHTYTIPNAAGANGTYFSKSSDVLSPLPVHWVSFDVKVQPNCSVQLAWITATEQNSAYFGIERSDDGRTWKETGRVKAAGNTTSSTQYNSIDATPGAGTMHYRLRQVDLDGRADYSVIRMVNRNCGLNTLKVYPTLNQAGIVYVTMPGGYEQAQLRLLNIKGQVLPTQTTGNGLMRTVYIQTLPAGEYILQVINKGGQENFKIIYRP